jgi:HK97 family phage major capsid protein
MSTLHEDLRSALTEIRNLGRVRVEDNRDLTTEEQTRFTNAETKAKELGGRLQAQKEAIDFAERYTGYLSESGVALEPAGKGRSSVVDPFAGMSLGEQFVSAPEYKSWRGANPATRGRLRIDSEFKAPPTVAPAGGILPGAIVQPSPLESLWRRVASLPAQGRTDAGAVPVITETTFVNAADAVAAGAPKPESEWQFTQGTLPLSKIATILRVPDEVFEDEPLLRSYIDSRLMTAIADKLDAEVLDGTGVAPHMLGIMRTPGINADYAKPAAPATNADALLTMIITIMEQGKALPDGIVLSPASWGALMSEKATGSGVFLNGGTTIQTPPMSIWGIPLVLSPAKAAQTALVGAFAAHSMLISKGGIRIDSTNSHGTDFASNITALRAEVRAVVVVTRPKAFGEVTALTAPAVLATNGGSDRKK